MSRKGGSSPIAGFVGLMLAVLGGAILLGHTPDLKAHKTLVSGLSAVLFGGILFIWAISGDKPASPRTGNDRWGIGFETVTMIVGVVAAVIAIIVWTEAP